VDVVNHKDFIPDAEPWLTVNILPEFTCDGVPVTACVVVDSTYALGLVPEAMFGSEPIAPTVNAARRLYSVTETDDP
jgi:hypothetical protein